MPFNMEWKSDNCIISFSGNVNSDELIRVSNTIIGSSRFDSSEYTIYDLRNIDMSNLNEDDIKIIAAIDKGSTRWNKHLKVACVVNDDYSKNLVLEYKKIMFMTNWEIGLFSNLDEANNWVKNKN